MPRQPRFSLAHYPHHVIHRGVSGIPIFLDDQDYAFFSEKLTEYSQKYTCDLHAYVLLRDHIHLLLTPRTPQSLSKLMQSLSRVYSQYFRRLYNTSSSRWNGRYRASVVDPETFLLDCYHLIDTHPVRSRMVQQAESYRWSSCAINTGQELHSAVTPHSQFLQQASSPGESRHHYATRLRAPALPERIEEIVYATDKCWALGPEPFQTKIAALTNRPAAPKPRGGDRKSAAFRARKKASA